MHYARYNQGFRRKAEERFQEIVSNFKNTCEVRGTPEKRAAKSVRAIRKAFAFAMQSHEGQVRIVGGHYVNHPLAVALEISRLGGNTHAVCLALLHDVGEDCGKSRRDIIKALGKTAFARKVASSVAILSKPRWMPTGKGGKWIAFGHKHYHKHSETPAVQKTEQMTRQHGQILESTDKVAALVKICDRKINLRDADVLPEEKKRREIEKAKNLIQLARRLHVGLYRDLEAGINKLEMGLGIVQRAETQKTPIECLYPEIVRLPARKRLKNLELLKAPEPHEKVITLWGGPRDEFLEVEFPPMHYTPSQAQERLSALFPGFAFTQVESATGARAVETGRCIFRFRLSKRGATKEFRNIIATLNTIQKNEVQNAKPLPRQ